MVFGLRGFYPILRGLSDPLTYEATGLGCDREKGCSRRRKLAQEARMEKAEPHNAYCLGYCERAGAGRECAPE